MYFAPWLSVGDATSLTDCKFLACFGLLDKALLLLERAPLLSEQDDMSCEKSPSMQFYFLILAFMAELLDCLLEFEGLFAIRALQFRWLKWSPSKSHMLDGCFFPLLESRSPFLSSNFFRLPIADKSMFWASSYFSSSTI